MKRVLSSILTVLVIIGVFTVIEPLTPRAAELPEGAVIFNEHYYKIYDTHLTWLEAKDYCESLGGYLVTITSQEEQDFIIELIGSNGRFYYWLGGTNDNPDNEWQWITGEEWSYTNWQPSEPNNLTGNEHYLDIDRYTREYQWNDVDNSGWGSTWGPGGFICEWDYIEQPRVTVENPHNSWAEEELERAFELGLVPDSLNDPAIDLRQPITRVEFAGIAVRTYEILANTTALPELNNPFTDTQSVDALKAYNAGIMVGISATEFAPDTILNRETAATALTRVFKRSTMTGWTYATDADFPLNFTRPAPFADDANISGWARDSVYFMFANDIIRGTGNNMFAPRATTTAQQAEGYANATREAALLIALRMIENLG